MKTIAEYLIVWCGLSFIFSVGYAIGAMMSRNKMLDEWRRIESEWEDINEAKRKNHEAITRRDSDLEASRGASRSRFS